MLEEVIKLGVINWVRAKSHAVRQELFLTGNRYAWVKLFIKYNTPSPVSLLLRSGSA